MSEHQNFIKANYDWSELWKEGSFKQTCYSVLKYVADFKLAHLVKI